MKTYSGLPDLLRFQNGAGVRSKADWRRRRAELLKLILAIEYGPLPPAPAAVKGELLHSHGNIARFLDANHAQYRLVTGRNRLHGFLLDLLVPKGDGPFPVVLTGDGCWRYLSDEVTLEILRRGYLLASFNRVEIAADAYNTESAGALFRTHPRGRYGALAAWAWGYHRCVDFLSGLKTADAARIAITGHSRGGKTVLLAGATDDRIALTAPNNSGCGGAGCFRHRGPECETLGHILRAVPYWFSPRFKKYIDREDKLPFDQHALKALVAPRALLSTEALGDLWANPEGTWLTHAAAREVYKFLGAEEKINIWFRKGEHDHGPADWKVFLDVADWYFKGKSEPAELDVNPFPNLASVNRKP